MTRPKFVLAALLLAASTSMAIAAPASSRLFACQGITSEGLDCGEVIKTAVTERFTKKYPQSKYTLFITSGHGLYGDGSYSGSVAIWLGSVNDQAPHAKSQFMRHFAGDSGTAAEALAREKEIMFEATQKLMKKLGVD